MIAVLDGPGAGVEEGVLRRWCELWGEELRTELRFEHCRSEPRLNRALAASRDALGAVVNPGEASVAPLLEVAALEGIPVAWVDLDAAESPRPAHLEPHEAIGVRGRGVLGYRWAALRLLQRAASPCSVISYGPERDQVGDLRLPRGAGAGARVPVAVLLHGGFWRERWERDTIEPLAIDLARRGYATWNLEYRRVGPFGGGWPATFADVAAGIDHLRELAGEHPLDLDRVLFVGHSAGGQLALWAVYRRGVDEAPAVNPALIVSLAGIGDLAECARRGLGDTGNAAAELMGGPPSAAPRAYAQASPSSSLPIGVRQLVVQGERDNTPDLVDMNVSYARAAAEAGDEVELLLLGEADHFDLIDPGSAAWTEVASAIDRAMAVTR